MGIFEQMRLFVVCVFLFSERATFELECADKDNQVCMTADCSSLVGRLVCPKKCGLCSSACQDSGQHCDVVDCQDDYAQQACQRTCNACGDTMTASSSESCTDLSSFCSPTLCGEWSRAMEDCRKTCHPECRYQVQDGFEPPVNEATTEWSTTPATTTTSTTSTTSTTTAKPVDTGKCKCLEPTTGRSFEETSILKVDTSPGCSIRFICGQGCAKLYKLPEHCVSVTSTTTSTTTSTSTTTTTTTTVKVTTQKTTR